VLLLLLWLLAIDVTAFFVAPRAATDTPEPHRWLLSYLNVCHCHRSNPRHLERAVSLAAVRFGAPLELLASYRSHYYYYYLPSDDDSAPAFAGRAEPHSPGSESYHYHPGIPTARDGDRHLVRNSNSCWFIPSSDVWVCHFCWTKARQPRQIGRNLHVLAVSSTRPLQTHRVHLLLVVAVASISIGRGHRCLPNTVAMLEQLVTRICSVRSR